jgi:hypothetical protein
VALLVLSVVAVGFDQPQTVVHGKPGGSRPGYVDRPYTIVDAEARLSEVTRGRRATA